VSADIAGYITFKLPRTIWAENAIDAHPLPLEGGKDGANSDLACY